MGAARCAAVRLSSACGRSGDPQAIPSLVIASILAKKLAAGTTGAGLEIRIAPHGNFGGDLDTARANAYRYNAVARLLGLEPVCALTDATRPYQPYIGRGEALIAHAEILEDRAEDQLAAHHALCSRISDAAATRMGAETCEAPPLARLREAHRALMAAHGTEVDAFDSRVELARAAPRTTIRAEQTGVVAVDLGRIRTLLVARQREQPVGPADPPADPAGVILRAPAGATVEAGEPLMSVRAPEGEGDLAASLSACVRVTSGGEIDPHLGSNLEIV